MYRARFTLFALALLCGGAIGRADDAAAKSDAKPAAADAESKDKADELVTTRHFAVIGDQRVEYTATAGTLPMKSDDGKTKADMFFVAYTRDGVEDMRERPITFCFNGGPGSSSVWLHLGMVGPKRVKLNSDATPISPPYEVIDNAHSLRSSSSA